MDFYNYDPSAYYASEDDSPSTAGPGSQIQFEFGASTSISTSTSAQAQTVGTGDPPLEDNAQAKLWIGMAFMIVIVTVRTQ
jgi:hypothetical protein